MKDLKNNLPKSNYNIISLGTINKFEQNKKN
jgi:hypothetical protein